MNPPSALYGAMAKDRKPFTYTPGGLDLSEIKSERMAKRLMRNAMNQGLPELPQHVQSPPATSTPIAVPNFNCLPVQVFPINLPANPKSLLRTRSVPGQPREPPVQREPPSRLAPPSQFVNNTLPRAAPPYDTFNKNTPAYQQINNNRPASMYEYAPTNHSHMNYGSGGNTIAFLEPSYDAQFYNAQPKFEPSISTNVPSFEPMQFKSDFSNVSNTNEGVFNPQIEPPKSDFDNNKVDVLKEVSAPVEVITMPVEDQTAIEKKEVKVVTKQSNVEEQNGDQNGEGDTETEMVVKLPSKKSAAKTETKVEVIKKILPDGTVEEIKKTTTKTTIDGKTEIKTKTETRILPKEEAEEEEEEEEVEEVEEGEEQSEVVTEVKENGHDDIKKTEEKSETVTVTKKSVTVQESSEVPEEEEEEVEEEVEVEPVTIVLKKQVESTPSPKEQEEVEDVEESEQVEEENEIKTENVVESEVETESQVSAEKENEIEKEEAVEVVEEEEVVVEEKTEPEAEKEPEIQGESNKSDPETEKQDLDENKQEAEQLVENVVEEKQTEIEEPVKTEEIDQKPSESEVYEDDKQEIVKETQEIVDTKQEVTVQNEEVKEQKTEVKEVILTPKIEESEQTVPLREPSVPLEKVEDVEIKPIGASDFITKSHTESTEIIRSDKPAEIIAGPVSMSTEYTRKENIITEKRTIQTLDNTYQNMSQSIPQVKSFFTPHVENISSPQPSRPYQPVYPPEPSTERRHSLLLERLSMERQMPSDNIYQNSSLQYSNQSTEQQRQWSQEPQAEVVIVSNVKPSMIANQQWYQQTKKEVVQTQSEPIWQSQQQPQTQPQLSPQPKPQPLYQPQPQYEPPAQPQYQYQPTYIENNQQHNTQQMYSSYTSQPTNWSSSSQLDTSSNVQSNQYSFKESSPNYQPKSQPFPSSYVPPPWEQDSTYAVDNSQNYFQPPPQSNAFSPTPSQGWKPTPPPAKFSKPAPKAYIPPKPNQSFVKPVINVEPPKTPGRKTYYSEYERRYISVPESTYIPAETKFQPQPDPSPQYYYDNNEPVEQVEPEWRKELREFTEKTQTISQTQSVKPPWEMESKYVTPEVQTPTPTWSQTLRPQSWRERSFESEFVSGTNTLGRARPLSSVSKESIPERTRGVSVDRYNPNSYQPPVAAEHPPVQTYTHNPPAPHATGYHNPNVPAYHGRASAEPREQPIPQARVWRDLRASPFQSRSFKYLQWITGTED